MKLDDFNFSLPREFIAQYPTERRGESKLLILDRKYGKIEHKIFTDIVEYFSNGDVLCINNTRVIPARLFGKRERTNGKVEVFLLQKIEGTVWEVLLRPAKKVKQGEKILFNKKVSCRIEERDGSGKWKIEFSPHVISDNEILSLGNMPLPPYIKRETEELDQYRYQTVYAEKEGSVAAPTAGLHFTEEILSCIEKKGVKIVRILLHIGIGTFRPVKVEDITEHKMESEYYEIDEESALIIDKVKKEKGNVFVVGTSTTRALETAFYNSCLNPGEGWTEKFIYPPYNFQVVDHLITNFHLPQTTLLMLVSAFTSREMILRAYEEAKKRDYRFFSYGDAMLIL
ncbi:tRNA preQ1(34) S-adenosylmethionine ribosyltransferase-isomerase QueA [candidate division WOR-3 bacterium]|nr:tRNA preQ1(34) S-adenosylmethionine ribosyltransferase-isomerase QueA [candidate division WOR-3 bacterium]